MEAIREAYDLAGHGIAFYEALSDRVTSWKFKALWTALNARLGGRDYAKRPCKGQRVLIVGGGPAGLRTAIELLLLGADVTVIDKRHEYTRNSTQ